MLVAMTKVQIVGRKRHVEPVLGRLYRMGLLELVSALEEPALELAPFPGGDERAERGHEQHLVLAQLEGLLTLAGDSAANMPAVEAVSSEEVSRELKTLMPLIEPLAARIEDLRTELAVLPRYIEPLRRLLPLVPELAELDENEIQALQLRAVALVLNTTEETVVDVLREALRTELGDRFVLVAVQVDPDAIGCVIVTPRNAAEEVQAVLGRERVRPLPLPSRYENLSFRGAVTAMESRLRSTGRMSICRRCLRRARGCGEQRASDSWAKSNRSKPWRRRGRQVARSSSSAGHRATVCPSCVSSSTGPPAASWRSTSSRRHPRPSRRY